MKSGLRYGLELKYCNINQTSNKSINVNVFSKIVFLVDLMTSGCS